MKTINLRSLYTQLQAMPHYSPTANTVSEARASEIAALFGECLDDVRREFADSNDTASNLMRRADTQGNGLGQYLSAECLFFGWLYDMHYEGACDSESAARHEFQDDGDDC